MLLTFFGYLQTIQWYRLVVCSDNQPALREWLCAAIGLEATKDLVCIGSVVDGELRGVVGYDMYNGSSIAMHVAGKPGWLNRELLRVCFDYPFNICKVNVILGFVPSGNKEALRFNKHLGFTEDLVIPGGHPDGALSIMTMRRENCRYLGENRG